MFQLKPPRGNNGENWEESILWSFGDGKDGNLALAGLARDAEGDLYSELLWWKWTNERRSCV